jgi:hypothetical protein
MAETQRKKTERTVWMDDEIKKLLVMWGDEETWWRHHDFD